VLLDSFATAFADADHVLVTDVYAAREHDSFGISAADLVARMDHPDVEYVQTLENAARTVLARIEPGDVLITLGAGDGHLVGMRVLEALSDKGGPS
jgi:UDP-N-acetylmuramate--alanine ligase